MIIERPSDRRGHGPSNVAWLDSRHTFSFGEYYDPEWMGFGVLRVINEDRVAPGTGFPAHGHANMEILSYVLDGALAHEDSSGGGGVIQAGELQWMSAGHGVSHSEFNGSQTRPVHFLQVWLQPDRVNAAPAYGQRAATPGEGRHLLASSDGRDGSLAIRQDAQVWSIRPAAGSPQEVELQASRRYWLQVARGGAEVEGRELQAGDALGFSDESGPLRIARRGEASTDVLLFDLPL